MANDSYGIKRVNQALVQSGSGTSVSNTNVKLNGELWSVTTLTGALSSGTAQITLVDVDGSTVFTGTATAASLKQVDKQTTPIMLSGLYTVTVTFSASQTNMITNATLIIKSV